MLVWVLLNGAYDLLMVKTLAVGANLGPAKLPDVRASVVSDIHVASLSSCAAVAEQKNLRTSRAE